jgi:gamma-glutamylcyclotransferase (GGCT)/AIG2-like uncharacterized protein YtfP
LHHLFVYGTLRRGSDNKFARMLADRARFVGTARVPGQLFDFGSYPAAVPSDQPHHWIHGEVWGLEDPEVLSSLDEYEGAEYERAIMPVQMRNGLEVNCWIYWYVSAVTGRLIASGDWFER